MENPRVKLIVILISLAAVLVVSIVLSMGSNRNAGLTNTSPWTPIPTASDTLQPTVPPEPTQTGALSPSPTPEVDPATNCTLPLTYWASHTEDWPARVTIADLTYTKQQAIAYSSRPRDAAADLFVQLHAAFLNTMSGADYTQVNETIIAAASWLKAHPVGSLIDPSDQQAGRLLSLTLADYNDGRLGPGRCTIEPTSPPAELEVTPTTTPAPSATGTSPATETPTVTPAPSVTNTPARRPSATPRPTQTQQHIRRPATRTATQPAPRPTIPPTRPPTGTPGNLPTAQPTTNTPAPTQVPPPTPAPTQLP